jgi:Protein of unknown function (DUF3592)
MPVRSGGAWFTAFSPPVSGSVLRVIKIRRHQDKGSPMLDAHQLLWTQIAAGACLLISGGLLFNLFRMRGQMRAASTWNRIEGVIIASEVRQPPSHLSDDLNDATPLIRYRYRAGSQDLESDHIRIGGQPMTTRVLAARLVARYPIGAHVDVYVDPRDCNNALLEPGASGNLAAQLAFTIVFGLIAAVLTAHAIAGHVLYARNGVPLFAFALPAIAILAAVFSVVSFARTQRLASASVKWPTVPGTVTMSSVIEEEIEDDSHNDKSIIRKIRRYQVDLRYAYQVGKRDFVGTMGNWGWTPVFGLREQAEMLAGKYRQGEPVTVYYDPAQPDQAVLEPSDRQGSMAPLIFAAIFAIAGGVMLAFFVKVGFGH